MYNAIGKMYKEAKKAVAGLVAASLVAGCAPTMQIRSNHTPIEQYVQQRKVYDGERIQNIKESLSHYSDPQQCSMEDNEYLMLLGKISIYDKDQKNEIIIPNKYKAWALSKLLSNTHEEFRDPQTIQECCLRRGAEEIYNVIKNSSSFYPKTGEFYTYATVMKGGNDLYISLRTDDKKPAGFIYTQVLKEGKEFAEMVIPVEKDVISYSYKSDKPFKNAFTTTLGGVTFSLVTHIPLLPVFALGSISGIESYMKEIHTAEVKKPYIVADKATLSFKDPEGLMKDLSTLFYLYVRNTHNQPKIMNIVVDNNKTYIAITPQDVKTIRTPEGIAFVESFKKEGLTFAEEALLKSLYGAVLGELTRQTAKKNAEKKECTTDVSETNGSSDGSVGGGGGNDQGGVVISGGGGEDSGSVGGLVGGGGGNDQGGSVIGL